MEDPFAGAIDSDDDVVLDDDVLQDIWQPAEAPAPAPAAARRAAKTPAEALAKAKARRHEIKEQERSKPRVVQQQTTGAEPYQRDPVHSLSVERTKSLSEIIGEAGGSLDEVIQAMDNATPTSSPRPRRPRTHLGDIRAVSSVISISSLMRWRPSCSSRS